MNKRFIQILLPLISFFILPLLTLVSYYVNDYFPPIKDMLHFLPGVLLYYLFITQLIIPQRNLFLQNYYPFPARIRFHQGIFRLIILLIVLHFITKLPLTMDKRFPIASGILITLVTLVLGIYAHKVWLSGTKKRKKVRDYNTQKKLHSFFYIIGILSCVHVILASSQKNNILANILIIGYTLIPYIFLFMTRYQERKSPVFKVSTVIKENENIISVYGTPLTPYEPKIKALSGQFGFFNFIDKNAPSEISFDSHPFTLTYKGDEIGFTANSLGDFTENLYDKVKEGMIFNLHAPFGNFSYENYSYQHYVFFGAGIGIAPYLSMLEHMQQNNKNISVDLYWITSKEEPTLFQEQLSKAKQELSNFNFQHDDEIHREDHEELITNIFTKKISSLNPKELGIFVCGPTPYVVTVQTIAYRFNIKKRNIHHELFSL